ncbi:hypothetical protein Ccrd_000191 [Cynara cardunculus var. scolymus]|uniref:Protein BIG GRAIN 1-like E n=2 Tax=Cynara cardunculus var. scolymus TaxID=59895 RepID=A0A124SDR1_CYNCS|nr:hypothetical protein Ccrd_000191 [Cynara cardunculus var. scolymus]
MQENKKPVYRRNGSGELHVFEAARYFDDTTTGSLGHKHYLREGTAGRLSLDIPGNNRRNSIPLQAMMMENRNSIPLRAMMMDQNDPMTIKNQKKYKQPSSPGGKLAHFLNSLFNQTYSKKSKSKSTTSKQSVKDEDESPSGWRRKRSSISLFRSGNSHTNNNSNSAIASDTRSAYNSRTPPPKGTASYKDLRSHSDHKPTCEITKIPINETHNKNENQNLKIKSSSGVSEKKRSSGNGLVEKVRVSDVKHDDDDHHQKYDPTVEIREFKRFILDDDDGDSDSSSDLFELTNCDLGYYSSGLPVFETTHMDNIKRGAPIVSS